MHLQTELKYALLAVACCCLAVDGYQYVSYLDSCLFCRAAAGHHSYAQPALIILADLHFAGRSAGGCSQLLSRQQCLPSTAEAKQVLEH